MCHLQVIATCIHLTSPARTAGQRPWYASNLISKSGDDLHFPGLFRTRVCTCSLRHDQDLKPSRAPHVPPTSRSPSSSILGNDPLGQRTGAEAARECAGWDVGPHQQRPAGQGRPQPRVRYSFAAILGLAVSSAVAVQALIAPVRVMQFVLMRQPISGCTGQAGADMCARDCL